MRLEYWSERFEKWSPSGNSVEEVQSAKMPIWTKYRLVDDNGNAIAEWPMGYVATKPNDPVTDIDKDAFDKLSAEAWECRRERDEKERECERMRAELDDMRMVIEEVTRSRRELINKLNEIAELAHL